MHWLYVTVCVNICTSPGHAESLYIEMRDPKQSFSSRAAKTKKGSPTPPTRKEVVPPVASYVIYIHTVSDVYIYI